MKKIRMKFRKGIVSLLAVGAFVLISALSFYIITVIRNDIYQMHSYQLSMQAYYLAKEAASASLSALLMERSNADPLIQQTDWTQETLYSFISHEYNGVQVGTSDVTASGLSAPYYGETRQWVVLTVETSMNDSRAANNDGQFTYTMYVIILKDDPSIQIYNFTPDDLFGNAE